MFCNKCGNERKTYKQLLCMMMICIVGLVMVLPITTVDVSAATKKPNKVTIKSISSYDYNAVKIVWKKAANAKKYQVYRATSKSGKYKLIKTTTETTFINKKLTTGKKYYYKIRGVNGIKKGNFSAIKYATPKLKKVYGVTTKAIDQSTAKISWNKVNGAKGYQVYRSTKSGGTYKKIKTTSENSFTNTGLTADKKYYYKIRAYITVNGSNKYGAYSSVKSCMTEYDYEVYILEDYKNRDLYDGGSCIPIYIKTEDPDANPWFDFITSTDNHVQLERPQSFDDLEPCLVENDDVSRYFEKTEDGYLCVLQLKEAGQYTIKFIKYKDERSIYGYVEDANYKTIASFDVNCLDYDAAHNKWEDEVIKNNTDESMNSLEKMQAVTNYLKNEAGFRYEAVRINPDTGAYNLVCLATGKDAYYQPFWVTKRWDSLISPSVLTEIAEKIGGFDSVENLYYKYDYGTTEWKWYHFYCRVTYEGQEYDFQACPVTSTGLCEDIPVIDLSNTDDFIRIK